MAFYDLTCFDFESFKIVTNIPKQNSKISTRGAWIFCSEEFRLLFINDILSKVEKSYTSKVQLNEYTPFTGLRLYIKFHLAWAMSRFLNYTQNITNEIGNALKTPHIVFLPSQNIWLLYWNLGILEERHKATSFGQFLPVLFNAFSVVPNREWSLQLVDDEEETTAEKPTVLFL